MQEEEKNNGMEGMSVEEMFLGVQESYQEAQLRAQEENRAFARTEFFRMDKFGTYRLRILPIAPNPDGSPTRPGYEYPVHQLLLELEKPATGNKPQKMYVTVTRATDAGYSVDPIETYRRMAVEAAKEDGDDKLAEKIAGGSFGGGLKYSYGHCLYVFDLGERAKGVQMMTLSHAQFKDLDERKFKLWSKKLAKNPSYPCPISSVYDAYPVEIEKRKNGAKTEYVISIDNESEPVPLTKEELTALMGAPRIPEIIYRYTRYHLGATVEFLKQCDGVQMMTLSHAQFKDLDERKFKLWSKKLAKNPSYPCPISSVYDAYPVEIEKRKNGAKTEYVISIDNESEPVPLTKEELTALMGAPRIPEIIYRYTRYHLGATVEFLKQCDGIYGMSLMETDEMKTVIDTLDGELPKEDISAFSFDRRTKDNRENGREGGGISLDDLFERYDELQRQELGEKTEEGQELRAMIRGYIEQEGLSVRVTRSTSNRELLDLIESEMEGPKPSDEPEDVPGEEEEQPEETEERAGRPRHRR